MTVRPQDDAKRFAPRDRNWFVAMLLAVFLPTSGQFYNRDYKKAIVLLVVGIVCAIGFGTILLLLLGIGLWIWSVFDAIRVAKQESALW